MLVVIILCLVLLGDSTTGAETECGQPQRVHGALPKPEYRDVSSFAHNATIEYRCDVTHYLVDLTSWFRTCLNGKWDDVQFRCIAKTCPALTTPDNGQRVGYNHEVGTFAKFKCNDGYEMMGVAQLLCRTDMEWSPKDPPTCKPVRCRDDSYLANGRVFQETFRQEENTYGSTNSYSCNSGYDIKGPSVRTCQADKTWSGIQPICDMPRCPEIMAEHGEVEYMGDRARYTYAFITCYEGYGFGKNGVETVECLRSLQWESTLHCYKMVKSWKPENSYTEDRKDTNVEHNERYKIHCYGSYEMKQNGHYLGGKTRPRMSVRVMNLNGKLKSGGLDAHTLSCVEKRCFQRDINLESSSKVIVQPNREYVEHGQSFHLSCENGYEDRLEGDPDLVCISGNLKGDKPECTEKPCVTPTIENGKLTRSGFFYKSWYTKSIISGQSVLASCENNFFLYDNSKNEFMKERSMSIICELGNMTSIPSCRKAFKCEFPDDPFASYYVNGDKQIGVNTISHDVEVRVKCESGTKIKVSSDVRRCWDGAWESGKQFPVCEPEPCRVTKEKGRRFIKLDDGEVRGEVEHGQTVTVVCDIGFDIIGANSDIQCLKGQFDNMYHCVEKPCRVTKEKGRRFIKDGREVHREVAHGQNVTVECDTDFDIIGANSEIQCIKGQFDNMYQCVEKPCRVTKEKGRRFIERDGGEVKDDTVGHGQTVNVVCDIDFDRTDANSEIKCLKGQFDYMYQCLKRCAIPEIPNANITRLNGTSTDKLKHGEMIKVTCPEGQRFQSEYNYDEYNYYDPDSIFTCNNGTITELGNKTCELLEDSMDTAEQPRTSSAAEPNATTTEPNATTTAASTTKNTTETSTESDTTTISSDVNESSVDDDTGVLNCTIPASDDFKFLTLSGIDLIEGTEIKNGGQIIAEKECEDYYEGYYDVFYNDEDDEEEISPKIRLVNKRVNCSEGSFSDYTLVCDVVETPDKAASIPDECRTLPNGKVTDNDQSFECNNGYVNTETLLYERYSCSCDRDIPALVCNGRQAKCEPINCKLNSPIEQGMTLKYKGTFITASTIEAINHGGSVIFDCEIGANEVAYEPKNRMFKCDRGNWIEDNRNSSWSLGNIGTFPKCRTAKCKCQHGGTCIRDETCVCTTFSTGAQCERPICHGGCQNGGSCTFPNRCSCPKRFYGNRCETEGCGAPVENVDDRIYQIGATYTVTQDSCFPENIPSFKGQVTCDNGHWSEEVICLPGTRYRIRVKTADSWGFGDGTDGEVYLYMFGSKGGSGKIILNGEFDAGGEDFTDDQFVDVGEISHIRLGVKSKSQYFDGWTPESVGIEDVSRREYYKFVHDLTEIDDTSIILYPVDFCTPPADVRNLKPIYLAGDVLRLGPLNCAQGYEPQPSYTKCTEWGWTDNVVCVKQSTYRIRVKTVDYNEDPWSGTTQNLFIQINGSKAKMDWKQLSGNFGSGWITEQRIVMENIGQIQGIDLMASGKDKRHVIHERWKPEYVTIHVEDTDDLYVFRYNRPDYLFENATVLYPEGQCSRPFANYRQKVRVQSSDLLQEKRANDETDCKIQCIENHRCKLVMYNTHSEYCRGYSDGALYGTPNSNLIASELLSCYKRH